MIPKRIHYCWFGGKPLPKKDKKCIESWKKYCPDYEIIQWDESNYDVNKNAYMKAAYEEKKWGFVPDYARADIIYQHGGVYMDTDVELIKPLDEILDVDMYCGFESDTKVNFGLGFGAEAGHPLLKKILDEYEELSFYKDDGSLNLIPSPTYQTDSLVGWGMKPCNEYQRLEKVVVFPKEYLCPFENETMKLKVTDNTISIHHFHGSWLPLYDRIRLGVKRCLGSKWVARLHKIKMHLTGGKMQ